MKQRPENLEAAEDPEATLVAPRFDADDARRANPVIRLAEATERTQYAPRVWRARGARRSWMTALLAVALLAVAAIGGALVTKVMQGPRAEQTQEQTQAVPVQAAEAPPPQPSTPAVAEAPREEEPVAAKPTPRTRRARTTDAAVTTEIGDNEDWDSRDKASKKRREREEDVEKELRKALKRPKGKDARLVDVLTGP